MYLKYKNSFVFYLLTFLIFVLFLNRSYPQVETYTSGEYTYEAVKGDPLKARIYKLKNRLTVYMTVYKDEPRIQTYIAVKAGSKFDPSDATGLAHYLEHMLFKGTDMFGTMDYSKEKPYLDEIENLFEVYRKTKDTDKRKEIYHKIDSVSGIASKYAIANEYDKMMSTIGAKGTNAYTSVEQTVYVNNIPSNELDKWLTIEAERFRNPVMRLFHTELEAVYEEKNMGLDDDDTKVWEALLGGLFQKHPYGTQTTIGTIEHLKNPSLKKVIDYMHEYYVPNNIAICLSGDLDMDETINLIDEKFGSLPSKPVQEFHPPVEDPITQPIVKDVYGPNEEQVYFGFRFDGASNEDADMISLISEILSNGTAGLIDLNLVQSQKVLDAGCFTDVMKDYSTNIFYAKPRKGQTLEELTKLLLSQIELVKKGDFPDWMLQAVINNMKLDEIKAYENNRRRAHAFVNSFVLGVTWDKYIERIDRLSKISKEDVVEFANKHYKNNYVVVYKRTGEDKNVKKIEKPEITPVKLNRTSESDFFKNIIGMKEPEIQPVFLNYKEDLKQTNLKDNIQLLYKENTEDSTFNLYYVLDMGSDNDRKLSLAVDYLQYLGTSKLTPVQLKEEFYKIACSFSVSSSSDQVYVSLSGLSNNFQKGLRLFEDLLSDAQPDQTSLDNLVSDILKVRGDDKLSQDKILWDGMYNYAKYGPHSSFTNMLSEDELKSVMPDELISNLKNLLTYKHLIMYYGPDNIESVSELINKEHKVPEELNPVPAPIVYKELPTEENQVEFVNYPGMVQAQIIMLSKDGAYDVSKVPSLDLYNSYFGSGMSGIVFQELRESRALAYSVFSRFSIPSKLEESFYVMAYIATQADKLSESTDGLLDLLNNMPESDITFNSAKDELLEQIRTTRITRTEILFSYLRAKKLGLDYDIRQDVFDKVPNLTLQDIGEFQKKEVKGRKYTILVLGDKDKIDMNVLNKLGPVKTFTLEDIFGY